MFNCEFCEHVFFFFFFLAGRIALSIRTPCGGEIKKSENLNDIYIKGQCGPKVKKFRGEGKIMPPVDRSHEN